MIRSGHHCHQQAPRDAYGLVSRRGDEEAVVLAPACVPDDSRMRLGRAGSLVNPYKQRSVLSSIHFTASGIEAPRTINLLKQVPCAVPRHAEDPAVATAEPQARDRERVADEW